MATACEILQGCAAVGITLQADGESLLFDGPEDAVTPDLLTRLKTHKADLLALLRPPHEVAQALPEATGDAPVKPTKPVCRCGSTIWRDVPIHGGQSVRRDCGRCDRFLDFPVWYGKNT